MATLKTLTGRISSRDVRDVRIISMAALQSKGGFVGRAVVGAVVAGPVGAIIGAATRKTVNDVQVAFEITFTNGRTEQGIASQKAVAAFADAVRSGKEPQDYSRLIGFAVLVGFCVICAVLGC